MSGISERNILKFQSNFLPCFLPGNVTDPSSNFVQTDSGGFQCKLCSKKINTKRNIYRHYREYHLDADKVFVCPICDKIKETRTTFYKHMKSEHKLSWKPAQLALHMCPRDDTLTSIIVNLSDN